MRIVASSNSFVFSELNSQGFRLVNAQPTIVSTGEEALAAARKLRPDLVILDADMPVLDGCTVCERIKADPDLRETRVILVMHGTISAAQLQRLAGSGCDDVVLYRVPGEDLYQHAARLCGLPDFSRGEPVQLQVRVADAANETSAHAVSLSERSVELLLRAPISEGTRVRLRMRREGDPDWVEADGTVHATTVERASQSTVATVSFGELSPPVRARIADLALWEARNLPDGLRVAIRGGLDQENDFSLLKRRLGHHVLFDLSEVRRITSWGARNWILFLRSIDSETVYEFVNCSTVFIKHCSMVTDMLGKGRVLSFALPYECVGCGFEDARVLQSSSVTAAVRIEPPEFRCGRCGGLERFSELPDRYFSFLPT